MNIDLTFFFELSHRNETCCRGFSFRSWDVQTNDILSRKSGDTVKHYLLDSLFFSLCLSFPLFAHLIHLFILLFLSFLAFFGV